MNSIQIVCSYCEASFETDYDVDFNEIMTEHLKRCHSSLYNRLMAYFKERLTYEDAEATAYICLNCLNVLETPYPECPTCGNKVNRAENA